MSLADHYEGFEKERKFHMILDQALGDCPTLKDRTVARIIAHIDPSFTAGLFEIRPTVRRLKYIGRGCAEVPCPHCDDFFEMGKLYESIDFNGATYTIKGYKNGKKRIGPKRPD